jgi:hypothetical protein
MKWRKRAFLYDAPMGPKVPRSTVLSAEEEALAVAFRKHTLLPLDDCLYALQATIPHLTRSAKAATSTIPIVFATGADPVKSGLVARFNRPGGNATGVSDFGVGLGAKRLGLLHELLPGATSFAALVNPDNPFISDPFVAEVQAAGAAIGRQIEVVTATTNGDIDAAFATFAKRHVDAFLISPEALFVARRCKYSHSPLATPYLRSIIGASLPKPAA